MAGAAKNLALIEATPGPLLIVGADKPIGQAMLRRLNAQGAKLITVTDADLLDAPSMVSLVADIKPDQMLLAAGKSGGIRYNQHHPVDLMADNLAIQSSVLNAAHQNGVRRLLYLASSCCYPRLCPQPMRVESLFTGPLEPTNEAYATAKLAGLVLCSAYNSQHGCDFITAIPTNYFGPGDDFSAENSHVVGALIRRMHEAKIQKAPSVAIWGSGRPKREFIYVDDLADACLFLLQHYLGPAPINIGTGVSLTIADLAEMIHKVTGFSGDLVYNPDQPDGMPEKALDSTPLAELGWSTRTDMKHALTMTYDWFLNHGGSLD
jgi:GDP-L-fucose synthase